MTQRRTVSPQGGPPSRRPAVASHTPAQVDEVIERLARDRLYGRIPLLVLGAGVSVPQVPLLKEIGSQLLHRLESCSDARLSGGHAASHARALAEGQSTRREVAQLFSVLQQRELPFSKIWDDFSYSFLVSGWETQDRVAVFSGLEKAEPNSAHEDIACIAAAGECFVLSLNFDGLTFKALTRLSRKKDKGAIALHSNEDIVRYFTATTIRFIPAVTKIRGDVFYAECSEASCPQSSVPLALDRLHPPSSSDQPPLHCPICSVGRLLLQFSFPGYRAKEEAAYPMLWTLRRFIGMRLSALVIVGLSGRWDRYLLQFLFDFARERDILIVDVKPSEIDFDPIDDFRSAYYSSIGLLGLGSSEPRQRAAYARVEMTGQAFLSRLRASLVPAAAEAAKGASRNES